MSRLKVTHGVVTPLPAIFDGQNRIDVGAPKKNSFASHVIDNKTHGAMVHGAAGEWPVLMIDKRKPIAQVVGKEFEGRANVILHVGCMRNEGTIDPNRHAPIF